MPTRITSARSARTTRTSAAISTARSSGPACGIAGVSANSGGAAIGASSAVLAGPAKSIELCIGSPGARHLALQIAMECYRPTSMAGNCYTRRDFRFKAGSHMTLVVTGGRVLSSGSPRGEARDIVVEGDSIADLVAPGTVRDENAQ